MKAQKYVVKLTEEERKKLEAFIKSKSPKNTPQCKTHGKILLCLDVNSEKPLTPEDTAKECKVHPESIYKIRKQYSLEGLERVLYRKKRKTPPVPPKITGEVEAHIIATACSTIPEGREHWTVQMIADKIVLDGVLPSIGREAVRCTLKKHNISLN